MNLRKQLAELQKSYPLSTEWSHVTLYHDAFKLGDSSIQLIGLSCQHKNGEMVTGSAAELSRIPLKRAYFELVERTSTVEAELSPQLLYPLYTLGSVKTSEVKHTDLFRKSVSPYQWVYSRSNGVASQLNWKQACEAAKLELIERDRVLRSWYGEGIPVPLPDIGAYFCSSWNEYYEFVAYRFPSSTIESDNVEVVGVFSFPKKRSIPRGYGFGAYFTLERAIQRAVNECVQAIGFLWGEEIPVGSVPYSPTPDYHQERFLQPQHVELLKGWLAGKHHKYRKLNGEQASGKEVLFADLTPKPLKSKVVIVKASEPSRVPLVFGECSLMIPEDFPSDLRVHPLS